MAEVWKRMTKKRQEEFEVFRLELRGKINSVISAQPRHAFGHGFLWAIVTYKGLRIKSLIGSIDGRENWDAIEAAANEIPEVSGTWINAD